MTAECKTTVVSQVTGLGKALEFVETFTTASTPTLKIHGYQIQAVADTAEALDIGDVATVKLVIIKCVSNDVDIDTSYSASFNAEITVEEGEVAVFQPTGTIYIKNDDAAETSTVEYVVVGI